MSEKCTKAEVHPSVRRSFFDFDMAKCVMHFPSEPDYSFEFYDDEIRFSPSELEGLTKEEASDLRRRKDIAYLQS